MATNTEGNLLFCPYFPEHLVLKGWYKLHVDQCRMLHPEVERWPFSAQRPDATPSDACSATLGATGHQDLPSPSRSAEDGLPGTEESEEEEGVHVKPPDATQSDACSATSGTTGHEDVPPPSRTAEDELRTEKQSGDKEEHVKSGQTCVEECPEDLLLSEDESPGPASVPKTAATSGPNTDAAQDSVPSAKRPGHPKASQPSKQWAERQGVLEKIADDVQPAGEPNGAPEQFGQLLAYYIRQLPERSRVPFQMEVLSLYNRFYNAAIQD